MTNDEREIAARTAQAASDKETIRQLEEQVKKLAVENAGMKSGIQQALEEMGV